jgi:hypothetical protein
MTGLTILRAHEGRRLAKRFEQAAKQGFVTRHDYDKATWFSAESVTVADIHALHRLLLRMEADPGACVIRGEAAPETDRRRTRRNTAAFPETPRTWLMLDVEVAAQHPEDARQAIGQFGLQRLLHGSGLRGIDRGLLRRLDRPCIPALDLADLVGIEDSGLDGDLVREPAALRVTAQ